MDRNGHGRVARIILDGGEDGASRLPIVILLPVIGRLVSEK